jgi:hypothetical protein
MASYRSPGPINDLSPQPLVIDNGTLARTETAAPGPIGLDSTGRAAKTRGQSLGSRVLDYARAPIGQRGVL